MAITTPGVVPASVLVTGHTPGWLTTFARFARRTRYEDLPEEVVARTRLVILDCIGAMLAGRREPEIAEADRRLGRTGRSGSKLLRAFLGGTAGTMLEIDEGNQ
jgi:2-methylcitrate dehydratase PrpD